MNEKRRRSRRVGYEIFTFTAVFALPAAFVLAFPKSVVGFRASPVTLERAFKCAFVNLSQQEAAAALSATRTSWKVNATDARRFKDGLGLGELPVEAPFVAPGFTVRSARESEVVHGLSTLPPTLAAPAPRAIKGIAEDVPDKKTFSREEMLDIDPLWNSSR